MGAPIVSPAPRICAVGRALPKQYASQETLIAALREHWRVLSALSVAVEAARSEVAFLEDRPRS
jgi:hypothetical protein